MSEIAAEAAPGAPSDLPFPLHSQALPASASPGLARWKRLFDIAAAMAGLVLLGPLMAAIALLVRRDGGPALYSQLRPGLGGRAFRCLKFRTMRVDAEEVLARMRAESPRIERELKSHAKLADDPRVTPLGRILRAYSLDELPQLVNVLRGEMSIVGPRPRLMLELENAREHGACFDVYFRLRPGLTCFWQIRGRSHVDLATRYRLDQDYEARVSPLLDLAIIARTIPAILSRRGAL